MSVSNHLYRLIQRLFHACTSKDQYSLHPPFVFNLYVHGISQSDRIVLNQEALQYRTSCLLSSQKITKLHQNQKKIIQSISYLVSRQSSSNAKIQLLLSITQNTTPLHILELGTNLGITTYHLHKHFPNAFITSIDHDHEIYAFLKQHHPLYEALENVKFVNEDFYRYLDSHPMQAYDIVYLDGAHTYQDTLHIVSALKKHLHTHSLLVIDDIYHNKAMSKAWDTLIQDTFFTLSVDLFHLGALWTNDKLSKQHFRLKSPIWV